MTECDRFAAMMEKSAALKLRIAHELGGAVIGVVEACERSLTNGGKLTQSQLGQGSDYLRPTYGPLLPLPGGTALLGVITVTYDTSYKNIMIQDNLVFTYVAGGGSVPVPECKFFSA